MFSDFSAASHSPELHGLDPKIGQSEAAQRAAQRAPWFRRATQSQPTLKPAAEQSQEAPDTQVVPLLKPSASAVSIQTRGIHWYKYHWYLVNWYQTGIRLVSDWYLVVTQGPILKHRSKQRASWNSALDGWPGPQNCLLGLLQNCDFHRFPMCSLSVWHSAFWHSAAMCSYNLGEWPLCILLRRLSDWAAPSRKLRSRCRRSER